MADITIMGATYFDTPSVVFPTNSGGTAQYNETEFHTWMGDNPLFLGKVYSLDTTLDKTTFDTWSASTTAGTIQASENGTVTKIDLEHYEYFLEWLWCIDVAQLDGATLKAMPDRSYGAFYQVAHRRPYGLANFEIENVAYGYVTALYTGSQYYIYYNTSGNRTWTTTMYGVYGANTAGTLSSTSSATPNLTPKSPAITARCNASYFATGRKAEVDAENTTIKVQGNLYRVDKDTSPLKNMWKKAYHMYMNPL